MLTRLGFYGFVGGHDKHDQVDPSYPRQHVAHETLVARHIDEPYTHAFAEIQVGEAQVNRDSTPLLFLQTVGVGAGQSQH